MSEYYLLKIEGQTLHSDDLGANVNKVPRSLADYIEAHRRNNLPFTYKPGDELFTNWGPVIATSREAANDAAWGLVPADFKSPVRPYRIGSKSGETLYTILRESLGLGGNCVWLIREPGKPPYLNCVSPDPSKWDTAPLKQPMHPNADSCVRTRIACESCGGPTATGLSTVIQVNNPGHLLTVCSECKAKIAPVTP